jgi:hypothetical protein
MVRISVRKGSWVLVSILLQTIVFAQPPSIGLQLRMNGQLEIVNWQNQWANIQWNDSVWYKYNGATDILKTSLYEFRFFMQPVNFRTPEWLSRPTESSGDRYVQPLSRIYPEPMDSLYGKYTKIQVREWHRIHQQPPAVYQKLEDYFGPDVNLTKNDKALIRSILISYAKRNIDQCGANGLYPTGSLDSIASMLSTTFVRDKDVIRYDLKSVLIYLYEKEKLVATVGYDHDWNVLTYDRLYYDIKGRIVLFQRKAIGELEERLYTFSYNQEGQLAHVNSIISGYLTDSYEVNSFFSFTDFLYHKQQLVKIVTGGEQSSAIEVVKYVQGKR